MQSITLPIFMAAVGWLFTSAIANFSDKNIVQYRVTPDINENITSVYLENISPSLNNIQFRARFHCRNNSKSSETTCFRLHDSNYFLFNFTPPNFALSTLESESADAITIHFTVPGETSFEILFFRHENNFTEDSDDFYFFIEDQDDSNVINIKSSKFLAFLISNQTVIYLYLVVVFLILILISFIPSHFYKLPAINKAEKKIRLT